MNELGVSFVHVDPQVAARGPPTGLATHAHQRNASR